MLNSSSSWRMGDGSAGLGETEEEEEEEGLKKVLIFDCIGSMKREEGDFVEFWNLEFWVTRSLFVA